MYRYYCKDENCPGHTKSWERCCDLRAFATRSTMKNNPFQTIPAYRQTKRIAESQIKQAFA